MVSKLSQAEIDAIILQYGGDPGAADAAPPAAAPTPAPSPFEPAAGQPVPAAFPALEPAAAPSGGGSPIGLLANVELDVTVRLGQTRRSIREILSLGNGAVLELDSLAGETVDILVNGRLVAKGEVVVVQENYGVRIVELVNSPRGKIS